MPSLTSAPSSSSSSSITPAPFVSSFTTTQAQPGSASTNELAQPSSISPLDALSAVYHASMELLELLQKQNGTRNEFHRTVGDLKFARIPSQDVEQYLRTLDESALLEMRRRLQYLVSRVLEAAKTAVIDGELLVGVQILQSRVDEYVATTST